MQGLAVRVLSAQVGGGQEALFFCPHFGNCQVQPGGQCMPLVRAGAQRVGDVCHVLNVEIKLVRQAVWPVQVAGGVGDPGIFLSQQVGAGAAQARVVGC